MLSNSKESASQRDGLRRGAGGDAVGSLTGRRSLIHLDGIDAGRPYVLVLPTAITRVRSSTNHTLSADKSLVCAATTLAT